MFILIYLTVAGQGQPNKQKTKLDRVPNLQQLLKADTINNSIIEIDNFLGELCEYGDKLERLSEPQKMFYINQNLEREVNNGGFNQYFLNSSGDYAHETLQSLKLIGAVKTAEILRQAISKFPQGKVPKSRETRQEVIDKIDPSTEIWEQLDQEFFRYQENLNELNIAYIKKHLNEF